MYAATQIKERAEARGAESPEGVQVFVVERSNGQTSEAKLMAECVVRIGKARDRDAFRCVFDHFAPRVKAFLARRNLSTAQADDITQEVMMAVWRRAESYDPAKAAVSTWVYTIARNLHIDHFRKAARARQLDEQDPHFHLNDEPAADDLVERGEQVETVIEALSSLPADQRLVVEMAFTEGWSHRDIADRLALPLGTVKSRIRLAMDKMRQSLGELR